MRPLEVREVFTVSWRVYQRRFGTLLAVSVTLLAIPSLLQWLPGVGLLMSVALLFAQLLATGAFVRVAASDCVDLSPSATEAVQKAWSKYGKMLGVGLLSGLGVAAVAMVMTMIGAVILAVVAFDMVEQLMAFAEDPLSVPVRSFFPPFLVWTVLMLLPAIGLAILWWLGPMVVMVEGRRSIDSLIRSWRLVSPCFWRAAGVVLLTVVMIVLLFVFLDLWLPYYLAGLVVSVLGVPLINVVGTVLYLDLRTRSESLDHETLTHELT